MQLARNVVMQSWTGEWSKNIFELSAYVMAPPPQDERKMEE